MAAKTKAPDGVMERFGKAVGVDLTWRAPAIVGGVALILVGFFVAKHVNDKRHAETDPGAIRCAHRVPLADQRSVIVVTEVEVTPHGRYGSDTNYRLEAIDPSDGHRLARVQLPDAFSCVAGPPGLLWCSTHYVSSADFELRDAATLAVRVPHAKLMIGAPALAKEEVPSIDPKTGEAWLATADGRFWRIDATTLQGKLEEHDTRAGSIEVSSSRPPLAGGLDTPPTTVQFTGSPRETLTTSDHYGNSHALGTASFLTPRFLVDTEGPPTGSPPALWLEDGKVAILVHRDTVNEGAAMLVTAMGIDGVTRWTTTLAHGEIAAAWILDHRLVLAITAEAGGSVTALDAQDGHVVWRAAT